MIEAYKAYFLEGEGLTLKPKENILSLFFDVKQLCFTGCLIPSTNKDIEKMKQESFITVMIALYNLFDAPDKFLKVGIFRSFNDFVVMFPFMTMLPSIMVRDHYQISL